MISFVLGGLPLAPQLSVASDEDEDPAYMIYIDPDTGKYTRKRPDGRPMPYIDEKNDDGAATDRETSDQAAVARAQDTGLRRWAAVVIALTLVVGSLVAIRTRNHPRNPINDTSGSSSR